MFISKETLAAYLVIPLLSSGIFVNAKCLHTDGVRIKKNDRCFVATCTPQGTCSYIPCYEISIHHTDGSWTTASNLINFDIGQKNNFRIGNTEWELFLDGSGGFTVMSKYDGCNAGGTGCEQRAVRVTHRNPLNVSIWYWDCQNTGPAPE